MKNQYVKDCLAAINSVRGKVYAAMAAGDVPTARKLMGDLYALEVCLVVEAEKLVREMEYLANVGEEPCAQAMRKKIA